MALFMQICTLVVKVLCLPLHLMDAVGLYRLYRFVYPACLFRMMKTYNNKMQDKKTELFRSISEFQTRGKQLTLLEIGCGAGSNFKYFPAGCRVICTDPNPSFQSYLKSSMSENDHLTYERFVVTSGEDMRAIEDESVDVVVSTLVLCTVNDVPQTLREVLRILRPGGVFFFMEHVVAEPSTWAYFIQHVLQPAWYYFGDRCQVIRETWKYLESAGFSDLKLQRMEAPVVFIIRPHIFGYAVK